MNNEQALPILPGTIALAEYRRNRFRLNPLAEKCCTLIQEWADTLLVLATYPEVARKEHRDLETIRIEVADFFIKLRQVMDEIYPQGKINVENE